VSLFTEEEVQQVVEYFFRIKLANAEENEKARQLFSELQGPARITQFFCASLLLYIPAKESGQESGQESAQESAQELNYQQLENAFEDTKNKWRQDLSDGINLCQRDITSIIVAFIHGEQIEGKREDDGSITFASRTTFPNNFGRLSEVGALRILPHGSGLVLVPPYPFLWQWLADQCPVFIPAMEVIWHGKVWEQADPNRGRGRIFQRLVATELCNPGSPL